MSQIPSGQPLGTARIDFIGNADGVKAAAQEAKTTTEKTAQDINASQSQSAAGFDQVARRGISRVFGIVGIATTISAAIGKMLQGFREARDAGDQVAAKTITVNSELTKAATSAASLGEAFQNIASAAQALAAQSEKTRDLLDPKNWPTRIFEEIYGIQGKQRIQDEQALASAVAGAQRLAELRDAESRQVEATSAKSARQRDIAESLLGVQKDAIAAEREFQTAAEKVSTALSDQLDSIDQIRSRATINNTYDPALDRELQRLEIVFKRRAELAKAAIDKEGEMLKKAYADAFDSIREQAVNLFDAQQITYAIQRLTQAAQAIADQRGGLRR